MSKPREWWIIDETFGNLSYQIFNKENVFKDDPAYEGFAPIHVIEVSHLEQEVMRIEGVLRGEYESRVKELQAALLSSREMIERLSVKLYGEPSAFGMFDDEGTKV